MAKTNVPVKRPTYRTHEGGKAQNPDALRDLQRAVSTCMLFEDTFYEGGNSIANRLMTLASEVSKDQLISEIIHAKQELFLRHAPMWLAVCLTRLYNGRDVGSTIQSVIKRADELAEMVSLSWKQTQGRVPLTKQMKLGLGMAFAKFDEYQFSKWNRDNEIKLRDVMFMVHPTPPKGKERLYKAIADDKLAVPDTWEVRLSASTTPERKRIVWEDLLSENKLGALALIRNLRNMEQVGVDRGMVLKAMEKAKVDGILPFQFVSAWMNAPAYSKAIDQMAQRALKTAKHLSGSTVLLVDVSGSMKGELAGRSQVARYMAAGALASHLVGVCDDVRVFTFSNDVKEVQAIPGFGIVNAIWNSQENGGTKLQSAISRLSELTRGIDRFIVITDEQSSEYSDVRRTQAKKDYMVSVAPYEYGVAVQNGWVKIAGFSSAIIDWIIEEENHPLFEE